MNFHIEERHKAEFACLEKTDITQNLGSKNKIIDGNNVKKEMIISHIQRK